MAFIACSDKERKHRVNASGELTRTDYYCPNPKCNATFILVDCDDEIRSDHFRLKQGSLHIEGCEYIDNDVKLEDSGFSTIEVNRFHDILFKLQGDFILLLNMFNEVKDKINLVFRNFVLEAFKNIGYSLEKDSDFEEAYNVVKRTYKIIDGMSINNFRYGGVNENKKISGKWLFLGKIKLNSSFFYDDDDLLIPATELLKCILFRNLISKKWSKLYYNIFKNNGDLVKNLEQVQYFDSIEECAVDFANRFNKLSIKENCEYGTNIYLYSDNGIKKYYYLYPIKGGRDGIPTATFYELHDGDIVVADIHTHGSFAGAFEYELFSSKDLLSFRKYDSNFIANYLVVPSGVLQKYDGNTITIVSRDVYKDPTDYFEVVTGESVYDKKENKLEILTIADRKKTSNTSFLPRL